nr:C25 family cysteine peptidase [Tenuifilaceae bacterium]HPJ45914.1 C25 family cysteine peptidase [Tenuifilaceae bacterium]
MKHLLQSLLGFACVLLYTSTFAENEVTLVSSKQSETILTVKIDSYNFFEVETPNGRESIVYAENAYPILEKGAPDLPKIVKSVIIPDNGTTEVKILSAEYVDYENISIAPSKGNLMRNVDPAKVPYTYGEWYSNDAFYPSQAANVNEPYILRDFRGQTVNFYPFQYNPVSKVLRVYSEITVQISSTNSKGINERVDTRVNKKVYQEFDEMYSRHFINYERTAKYDIVPEQGLMLVVSDPSYMDAIQPLVDWKNQKGQPTVLISYADAGGSSANLKTYVTNQYNSEDGLMFLLIIGDGQHIPPLYKSGDSDAAYGHIVGTDSYAEVIVGRFSAESVAHVETQVERVITYERDLGVSATWLKNGLGLASDQGTGDDGETDIEHMDVIRGKLLGYNYTLVDQVYDPGATATMVVNSLNAGRGIINYVGHGSDYSWSTTGFGVSNMSSLTNVGMWPFIFDVACVNGNFVGQTCFAEAFIRANSSGPTGTLAIIASTINQDWSPPMRGQDEMNDILVESHENNIKRTFGGIAVNGCMNMNDVYSTSGYNMTNTWTIFGDPSVMVRTDTPQEMVI